MLALSEKEEEISAWVEHLALLLHLIITVVLPKDFLLRCNEDLDMLVFVLDELHEALRYDIFD